MQIKTATPDKFTKKQQEQLSSVAEQIIDLEEQIELAPEDNTPAPAPAQVKAAPAPAQVKAGYTPEPGTENLVHLSIVRGRRFDENTGQEVSVPYVQKFTYGEYKNFLEKANLIGYTIVETLYNPYKD